MVYVTNGQVFEKQTIWRLSIFSDVFWFIVNIVGLFFSSLFRDPSEIDSRSKGRAPWGGRGGGGGNGGGGGGGGPPKKKMGRVNNRSSLNQPMAGG